MLKRRYCAARFIPLLLPVFWGGLSAVSWAGLDPSYQPDWHARQLQAIANSRRNLDEAYQWAENMRQLKARADQGCLPLVGTSRARSGGEFLEYNLFLGTSQGPFGINLMVGQQSQEAARPQLLLDRIHDQLAELRKRAPRDADLWEATFNQLTAEEVWTLVDPQRRLESPLLNVVVEPSANPVGVRILKILANRSSPAVTLKVGDIITHVEQRSVNTPQGFLEALGSFQPDSVIRLSLRCPPSYDALCAQMVLQVRPAAALNRPFLDAWQSKWAPLQDARENDVSREMFEKFNAVSDEEFAKAHRPKLVLTTMEIQENLPGMPGYVLKKKRGIAVSTSLQFEFVSMDSHAHALADVESRSQVVQRNNYASKETQAMLLDHLKESYAYLASLSDEQFAGRVAELLRGVDLRELGETILEGGEEAGGSRAQPVAWLGVKVSSPSTSGAQAPKGVTITSVVKNSPAAEAKFQVGDVLLTLEQRPLTTPESLQAGIQTFAPGSRINIEVWREGKKIVVPVTLVAKPD